MWVFATIVIILHISWRFYSNWSVSSQQKNTNTTTKDERVTQSIEKELQHSIENIDAGNSEITEEELVELVKLLATINKSGERISKTIACEKILHCSTSTFDNYVREGIIPPGRKVAGFKELSWNESDFIGIKLKRIRNAVK